MTQKILEYDRNPAFDVQDTYYWCGPASTQMILQARGIVRDESDLARELGTTTDGTSSVERITPVLNGYLPDAHYETVLLQNDPITPVQKGDLWAHIVHSIDAGYGVSNNIVAPPSNYPRGVMGSETPHYNGGTIFHYRAFMGYDTDFPGGALWVADSGFRPFGYWEAFDQTATLIPPKGYAWANAVTAQLLISEVEGLYI